MLSFKILIPLIILLLSCNDISNSEPVFFSEVNLASEDSVFDSSKDLISTKLKIGENVYKLTTYIHLRESSACTVVNDKVYGYYIEYDSLGSEVFKEKF